MGPAAEDFLDTEVLSLFVTKLENLFHPVRKEGSILSLCRSYGTPSSPEAEFEGKSGMGVYGDFVMNTDACIGRVREHLRKAGVDKSTIVIVSSDHGPGHYSGRQRKAIPHQMKEMEKEGHFSRGSGVGISSPVMKVGCEFPLG